jgi:lipoic acid synthetase
MGNCFNNGKLTFMILGKSCTRDCKFCGVNKSNYETLTVDEDEPKRILCIIKEFGLKYVVITSVTRDDLADGGAGQFVRTIKAIHDLNRNIIIEVLIPDFEGNISNLKSVLDAGPDVVAHNIETISRLYKKLRPEADYRLSLEVLSNLIY